MQETPSIPVCLDEELKRLARSRSIDNYKEVAIRCDIGPHEMRFSTLIGFLNAVNERECARGAPLLAAVVISKELKMPGAGFFKFPPDHNLIQGTEKEFWKNELERVFDYWARHD